MRRGIVLVTLAMLVGACGGSSSTLPKRDRSSRPRATPPWGPGCVDKKDESAACVELSFADVTTIREVVLARLQTAGDVPDLGMMLRLAEPPVAQWTTSGYRFLATTAPAQPGDVVELTAFESVSATMLTGFTAVLARTSDSWQVVALALFAEGS